MDGRTLAFSTGDPTAENLDKISDSWTCFGKSGFFTGPEQAIDGNVFRAIDLAPVQAGLNRLRSGILGNHEFSSVNLYVNKKRP